MKRIAILTLFHNSTNYGGNLQAYALCKALNRLGFDAQQLRIDCYADCYPLLSMSPSGFRFSRMIKRPIKRLAMRLLPSYRRRQTAIPHSRKPLLDAFHHFNYELTPHSNTVYTPASIHKSLAQYDGFVTGSDQVWNPRWYCPSMFLDFVPSGTPKLSYAASIAQDQLPDWIADLFRKHLKDFTGVSVREEAAVALLEGIAPGPVSYVLDPTLLLSRQDWEQVCAPRQIEGDYVFCYFLGDDLPMRNTATAYAQAHGLKLVTIPNATGLAHTNDKDFGDIALEAPSPEAFISLIRHAEAVFTDSFHASVFSLIYQRQFFVFARVGHKSMGSRLESLTELFQVPERYCDSEEKTTAAYVEALPPIDYSRPNEKLAAARQVSLDFLKTNLPNVVLSNES